MSIKTTFLKHLESSFPGLKQQPLDSLISENLLSPLTVTLPASVLADAQKAVRILFGLREKSAYRDFYQPDLDRLGIRDPGNKSIAMSYDFHVTSSHELQLIEVNTNASFLALGHEMYRSQRRPLPITDFSMQEIAESIREELRLQGKTANSGMRLEIIDEHPEQQRLFVEFLLYNEFFKSCGWNSDIHDFRDPAVLKADFVYNRTTDFFLADPQSGSLRKAFLDRTVCLSPNPYEYFLLADKQRLIDWSHPDLLQKWGVSADESAFILKTVPRTVDLHEMSKEELWAQRKHLFFKPKRAFGSKQSYRGSSISRKAFDEIASQEFVAQEYVPAMENAYQTPDGEQTMKFDLRCYAYQGRLQLVVARLYQGQVTNLRTPYGGFACVLFK